MNADELLEDWLIRSKRQAHAHARAAARYDRYRKLVGVPSIILSTVVGTAVFSEVSQQAESGNSKYVVVGLVLAAAGLSAMQTFLRFDETSGKHSTASNTFSSLRRKIDLAKVRLKSGALSKTEIDRMLDDLRVQFDDAVNEVPPVPQSIWDFVEKKYPRK